ncbi:MFS transporter [Pseudonocardia alni]|uniref:MFS transporter n=1 Tax=Pseudonocardia alni TaxID=33907 RepID=UPI00280A6ACA|nr:MFS transporter [Pseudonocardia alni]
MSEEVPRSGALALLMSNRGFRGLTMARVISFVGDSLSLVALMLHVASTSGQALAVAALLLVGDFVPSLLSPLSGALSDRFDRRRVMIVCEVVQGVTLLVIAAALPVLPLPLLLVLVGVRAVAGQVFQPASRAAMPSLVAGQDLDTANSTLGFGTNGAEALGPLVAAALFPVIGIQGVLLADAASFGISALIIARLPALPPTKDVGDAAPGGLFEQAREGLGYLWRRRSLRIITLGFCAVVAANGIDDVALLVLATENLGAGESATAVLLGGVGIGLLAGYALLARGARRTSMVVLMITGFAISSIGNLLTGLAWAIAVAFALQTIRGFGIAAMDVGSNTLLQRLVPDSMLGRVFGNLYGVIGAAAALSYVGGGLLLDATSAPITFIVAGTVGTVATAATALTLHRALPTDIGGSGIGGMEER